MSNLSDRVAYLKGLAEGMEIGEESKMGKLVSAIIDTLGEVAESFQRLSDEHEELDEYVESIDDDLAEIEEALFDDEDDMFDIDEDEDEDEDLIECTCPHCGHTNYFIPESFDLSEDHTCPSCHKPLFDEDGDGPEQEDKEK